MCVWCVWVLTVVFASASTAVLLQCRSRSSGCSGPRHWVGDLPSTRPLMEGKLPYVSVNKKLPLMARMHHVLHRVRITQPA